MNTLHFWNPLRDLQDAMRGLLVSPASSCQSGSCRTSSTKWYPAVEIVEDATGYTITAEVPGLTKADVKVELLDGTLTIKGERTRPEADASTKTHRTERCYGTLQRSFGLPEDADAQKVSAECKEGLLVVRLPKSEVKKPAQIDVTVN